MQNTTVALCLATTELHCLRHLRHAQIVWHDTTTKGGNVQISQAVPNVRCLTLRGMCMLDYECFDGEDQGLVTAPTHS